MSISLVGYHPGVLDSRRQQSCASTHVLICPFKNFQSADLVESLDMMHGSNGRSSLTPVVSHDTKQPVGLDS